MDWRDLAASQIELFQTDMEALNVLAPDHYVGAVESIPLIVPAIERLAAATASRTALPAPPASPTATSTTTSKPPASTPPTPPTPGPWAPSPACPTPRCWSSSPNAAAIPAAPASARRWIPLLWRVARDGEPSWPGGELGEGRPGWHIECTVIAQKYLPAPFTVQGGGSDLIFPHHEMGAGHAYSLSGVPLARHFAHAGMVGLDGEKMSKSKGNLVLVSKLRAAGEEPAAIRLAILAHHYRTDWSWTDAGFAEAKDRLRTWRAGAGRGPGGLRRRALSAGCGRELVQRPQRPRRPGGRGPLGRGGAGRRRRRVSRGRGAGERRRQRAARRRTAQVDAADCGVGPAC